MILYENAKGPDDFEKFQLQYSVEDFIKLISQFDSLNLDFDPNLKIYYFQTGNYRNGEAVMFYMDRQIVQYTFINSE